MKNTNNCKKNCHRKSQLTPEYYISKDPFMLDEPGLIVEPDAKKLIKKYLKSMKLSEIFEYFDNEKNY